MRCHNLVALCSLSRFSSSPWTLSSFQCVVLPLRARFDWFSILLFPVAPLMRRENTSERVIEHKAELILLEQSASVPILC